MAGNMGEVFSVWQAHEVANTSMRELYRLGPKVGKCCIPSPLRIFSSPWSSKSKLPLGAQPNKRAQPTSAY